METLTLKLVTFQSASRDLKEEVRRSLLTHIEEEHVLPLLDHTVLVYTTAAPLDIRDWLKGGLSSGEHVFVVEFEHWSGYGESEAWKWLLWRGH